MLRTVHQMASAASGTAAMVVTSLAGTIETFGVWRRAGKDVALQTLKGEGHVFAARRQVAMDALTAFFANHLK